MKEFFFWFSYLYLPFLIACIYFIAKNSGARRLIAVLVTVTASIIAYARFVEPHILLVKHSEITLEDAETNGPTIKLALFSDTHFGIFKNAVPMQRIVDRINVEEPDAVMIAGDFLYHLAPRDIPEALAPLTALKAPVFAVLGNHDVGFPGPIYKKELYAALTNLGVNLVENRAQAATLADQNVIIAGTSDLWEKRQDYAFATALTDVPIFLLTHNPDTAYEVPGNIDYDLMLAGHTHGGQIRLPGLYAKVIPTVHPFDKGLHTLRINSQTRRVFVTPGTGMVGLPLRFNMPPRVDILTVKVPSA